MEHLGFENAGEASVHQNGVEISGVLAQRWLYSSAVCVVRAPNPTKNGNAQAAGRGAGKGAYCIEPLIAFDCSMLQLSSYSWMMLFQVSWVKWLEVKKSLFVDNCTAQKMVVKSTSMIFDVLSQEYPRVLERWLANGPVWEFPSLIWRSCSMQSSTSPWRIIDGSSPMLNGYGQSLCISICMYNMCICKCICICICTCISLCVYVYVYRYTWCTQTISS